MKGHFTRYGAIAIAIVVSSCGVSSSGPTGTAQSTGDAGPLDSTADAGPVTASLDGGVVSGVDAGAPGVRGWLWHNNYALDIVDGTQLASLSGALPIKVNTNTSVAVTPWPDGTQYATSFWNVADGYTDVDLVDLATKQPLHQLRTTGYLRSILPSPKSKTVIRAVLGADSVADAEVVLVDVEQAKVLQRFDAAEAAVSWLPDGRFMRIKDDGSMYTGTVGQPEQLSGHMAVPADHVVGSFWVNPQGTKLAIRLRHRVWPSDEIDIWVADIDGGHLERFTATKMTAYAVWSPDGQYLAFDVDSGLTCSGAGCIGDCFLWYAPATARNLIAVFASHDALKFQVTTHFGQTSTLGCDLLGWTP